jgi:hypothetical protein
MQQNRPSANFGVGDYGLGKKERTKSILLGEHAAEKIMMFPQ